MIILSYRTACSYCPYHCCAIYDTPHSSLSFLFVIIPCTSAFVQKASNGHNQSTVKTAPGKSCILHPLPFHFPTGKASRSLPEFPAFHTRFLCLDKEKFFFFWKCFLYPAKQFCIANLLTLLLAPVRIGFHPPISRIVKLIILQICQYCRRHRDIIRNNQFIRADVFPDISCRISAIRICALQCIPQIDGSSWESQWIAIKMAKRTNRPSMHLNAHLLTLSDILFSSACFHNTQTDQINTNPREI